jgi:hypothetical protein
MSTLIFALGVNVLVLGLVAIGLLAAALVVGPIAVGAGVWERRDRASFRRWSPLLGSVLALLALFFLPL